MGVRECRAESAEWQVSGRSDKLGHGARGAMWVRVDTSATWPTTPEFRAAWAQPQPHSQGQQADRAGDRERNDKEIV